MVESIRGSSGTKKPGKPQAQAQAILATQDGTVFEATIIRLACITNIWWNDRFTSSLAYHKNNAKGITQRQCIVRVCVFPPWRLELYRLGEPLAKDSTTMVYVDNYCKHKYVRSCTNDSTQRANGHGATSGAYRCWSPRANWTVTFCYD